MGAMVELLAHWSYPIVAVSLALQALTVHRTIRRLERAIEELSLMATDMTTTVVRLEVNDDDSMSMPSLSEEDGSTHQSGGAAGWANAKNRAP